MNLSQQLPEVFSYWSDSPQSLDGDLSFDVDGGPDQGVSVWRMDLPADPSLAADRLNRADIQVAASQSALSQASSRIDHLVDRGTLQGTSQVSFSSTGLEDLEAQPLPPPERELLVWLESVQPGQVSYGLGERPLGDLREARQKFEEITRNLLRLIAYYAWVETQLEGRLLARTVVSHTGDMKTAWQSATQPEEYALHQRSLKLALASRTTLLRTFTITAQSAAKLSLMIATPGGALLALPAAWKFVESILKQVDEYQTIKQEAMEI